MEKTDIMTEEQHSLLLSIVSNAHSAVVVGHKNPDGDAVGACLAWAYVLRNVYGVNATVIMPDSYPDYFQWLPDSQTIINYERRTDIADGLIENADTVFLLDCNNLNRTGRMEDALAACKAQRVIIDHHLGITSEAMLTVSDNSRSSTCEVLFCVVRQMGLLERMSNKWASMIYCGMMTDTGGFTYNSSRPEIFHIVGELLAKGIDKDRIYRLVFNNFSSWAVRFRGYVMCRKLNVHPSLRACWFTISRHDMLDWHFQKGDAEGLVNIPLTIKGMRLSVSLREDDRWDNIVWVSIRSLDDFPANEMAEQFFNGGG
ncbi:MAG: DHH family phosphoesterase, partial [Prevotella sp.]|nr:DHH family phosphoesterase [Prevotella sp.]